MRSAESEENEVKQKREVKNNWNSLIFTSHAER